eukprot:TRINITY_DN102413_c0_g1_i1.p1 TRINITY_DN102413_c0_g1~~TRINITY_DN102413_c0_g1_i1.p1  ORF type:complete len:559 (-),score=58.82 TRINITY_DN102413_c0_g1_i1:14-1690(-)
MASPAADTERSTTSYASRAEPGASADIAQRVVLPSSDVQGGGEGSSQLVIVRSVDGEEVHRQEVLAEETCGTLRRALKAAGVVGAASAQLLVGASTAQDWQRISDITSSNPAEITFVRCRLHFEGFWMKRTGRPDGNGSEGVFILRDPRQGAESSVSLELHKARIPEEAPRHSETVSFSGGDELMWLTPSSLCGTSWTSFSFSADEEGSKLVGATRHMRFANAAEFELVRRSDEAAVLEALHQQGNLSASDERFKKLLEASVKAQESPVTCIAERRLLQVRDVEGRPVRQVWLVPGATCGRLRRSLIAFPFSERPWPSVGHWRGCYAGEAMDWATFQVDGTELEDSDALPLAPSGDFRAVTCIETSMPPKPASSSSESCFTADSILWVCRAGGNREEARRFSELQVGEMVRTGARQPCDRYRRVMKIWPTKLAERSFLEVVKLGKGCALTAHHPVWSESEKKWLKASQLAAPMPRIEPIVYGLELEGHVDTVLVGDTICAAIGVYCGPAFAAGGWNVFTRKTTYCDSQPCKKCDVAVHADIDFSCVSSEDLDVRYSPY